MDGPNVNLKFFEMLQEEHGELYGGKQLAVVGTCGLHTVHNVLKYGFSSWQIEKILRALHTLFLNVPACLNEILIINVLFTFVSNGHYWDLI